MARILDEAGVPAGRRQRAARPQVRRRRLGDAARPAGAQAVVHRQHRGRPGPAQGGGRPGRQLLDGARRQRPVPRLRRRRPRRRHRGRDDRQDAQRRRGVHRRQPVLRGAAGRRRVRPPAGREDEGPADGPGPRRRHPGRPAGQRRRRRQGRRARARRRRRRRRGRRRRPPSRGREVPGLLLRADRAARRARRARRSSTRRSSARSRRS